MNNDDYISTVCDEFLETGNYSSFVSSLDALDLPPNKLVRILVDVIRAWNEDSLSEGFSLSGPEKNLVHIDSSNKGIYKFDMSNPVPSANKLVLDHHGEKREIECFSVFGRNDQDGKDGNPVIYALKKIRGFEFATVKDYKYLMDYYVALIKKMYGEKTISDIDTVIPSPSSSDLNMAMVAVLKRECNPSLVSVDKIRKRTVDVVYSEIMDDDYIEGSLVPKKAFKLGVNSKEFYKVIEEIRARLERSYEKNKEANAGKSGDPFSIKYIPKDLREEVNDYLESEFDEDELKGRNVLIVDDTITPGKTLRLVSDFVLDANPASVKIFTLFSTMNNKPLKP